MLFDACSYLLTLLQVSPEPRLGLNQARDLLLHEANYAAAALDSSSPLRYGNVHVEGDSGVGGGRCGPGYYQCSRFSPKREMLIVGNWPEEYKLRFRADRAVYLMGACVTETDRQFYSPKVREL